MSSKSARDSLRLFKWFQRRREQTGATSTLQRGDVLGGAKGALLRRRCAPLTQPARAAVLEMSMGSKRSAGSPGSDVDTATLRSASCRPPLR
jgi:hypothetical protein